METKAKIIIGDSRLMKEVKDEEIDLIVTSLPYQIIERKNDKLDLHSISYIPRIQDA